MDINSYIASGIIELYVLGMCSAEEKVEVEALRCQHPALDKAILQYEKAVEDGLMNYGTMLPASVDEKLLRTEKNLSAPVIEMPAVKPSSLNYGWWKLTAAAAVILLLASAVFNYTLYKKLQQQQAVVPVKDAASPTLPATDYTVMTNPKITPVAMYGVGSHSICRCTMFWDKRTGKMYILIQHLPLSSASRDYQLWATVNGKQVSVGVVNDAIRGRFIEMKDVPAGAVAFSVTLEKAGGTTQPTESETYLRGSI